MKIILSNVVEIGIVVASLRVFFFLPFFLRSISIVSHDHVNAATFVSYSCKLVARLQHERREEVKVVD